MSRKARAVINLEAIRDNYRLARSLAPENSAVAIVKADAYGHGAVKVAEYLEPEVDAFGVACIEEAMILREGGIQKPVLLLEGFFDPSELPEIVAQNFWTAIHSEFQIDQLATLPEDCELNVWLKMDSGMHRLGVAPEDYASAYARLQALPQVKEVVMMSHFSSADDPSDETTLRQVEVFARATEGLSAPVSIANSPATLGWEQARGNILRPGLMMYGASPFAEPQENADKLKPAMSLLSEVIAVRDVPVGESVGYSATWTAEAPSRIGTVAMGYGDGFPRHAKNGTPVMVNGVRTRIVGRVSMDMITVDLTDVPNAEVGAEVEFFGNNLSINEVATWCDTIPYTMMTCLTPRIARVYK